MTYCHGLKVCFCYQFGNLAFLSCWKCNICMFVLNPFVVKLAVVITHACSCLLSHRYIEIFPSRRNEVRTHVGSHKGKKAASPTAKFITEPEVVFEEQEVNEEVRPMTAFESEKEIGNLASPYTHLRYFAFC